jgi:hypothetical protein
MIGTTPMEAGDQKENKNVLKGGYLIHIQLYIRLLSRLNLDKPTQ